ncbi:MAG: alpha/beta fold hydrolase [Acidimicrobiia bacterium]
MPLTTVVEGDGEPTVVFVHGVLDRGRSFAGVAAELRHEYRTVRYDRRGYGDSQHPDEPVADLSTHIDDLLAIIGDHPAVIAAHSHGGLIALGAALRRPDIVRAILLYETAISWLPEWPRTMMDDALYSDDPISASLRALLKERVDTMSDAELAIRRRDTTVLVTEMLEVRRNGAPFDLRKVKTPIVYGVTMREPFARAPQHLLAFGCDVDVVDTAAPGHNLHRDDPVAFAALTRRAVARHAEAGSHAN